jgi:hypothetical protein
MAEHVRIHPQADPRSNIKQHCCEGDVPKWSPSTPAATLPCPKGRCGSSLLGHIPIPERPEIIRHRHAVLVASALEPNADGPPSAIDVIYRQPENAVSIAITDPVTDAGARPPQQRQDRLVPSAACCSHESRGGIGVD